MLLSYGARNFFCFKEGFEVSLRLGTNCPQTISHNKNFATVLCVKGANASGKTNVLKSLAFLRYFCCDSFNQKPDEKIFFESFFANEEPSHFFVDFKIDDVEYRYELEVSSQQVFSEKIYKKVKRQTLILERDNEKIKNRISDFSDIDVIKLRKNASIISTAYQYEISTIQVFYDFFLSIISNVSFAGLSNTSFDVEDISRMYYEENSSFTFVKEIIFKCDLGVKDIQIMKEPDEQGSNTYYPVFIHDNEENVFPLPYVLQSSGTKSLFLQLWRYEFILRTGGVLVLDEFDINLHPDILPLLVDLFLDEEKNTNKAQLLFTTHNSNIMNTLGKYRTILVNKENNESFLYRLDEVPGDIIRNDRPLEPIYKSGKIGGVPRI